MARKVRRIILIYPENIFRKLEKMKEKFQDTWERFFLRVAFGIK